MQTTLLSQKDEMLVCRRRMKYFGHIARYPAERWVRKLVAGEANQKKSIGRPPHTWYNATINDIKDRGATIENSLDKAAWRKFTSKGQPKNRKPAICQDANLIRNMPGRQPARRDFLPLWPHLIFPVSRVGPVAVFCSAGWCYFR